VADTRSLSQALDRLEEVQAGFAEITGRTDERWRHDMITQRRLLSAQVAEVGRLADPWIAARNDAETTRAYRERFSRMRSAAALHQAAWPVVSLDPENPEYRSSALNARQCNRAFVDWLRGALAAQ
jgi:hypothetical protein